jgi:NADH-quinone oxidoreductase subunit C
VSELRNESQEQRQDGTLSATPSHPTVTALASRFQDAFLRHEVVAGDEHVVWVDPDRIKEILGWLKEDPDHLYNYLSDVTAVDYGGGRPIQVVYQLFSIPHRRALRVKAELPLTALEIDSVEPLWKSADWLEREVYDMFGVVFRGHPDLRRILMPEIYAEGHPLRKDFPLRGRFTRAEQTQRALAQEPEDYYIPELWESGREPQLVRWQELEEGEVPGAGSGLPDSDLGDDREGKEE